MKKMPFIGVSALLVIFATLCLAVFALLSVATARSQVKFGQNNRDAVSAYYQADSRAQQILARLRAGEMPGEVTEQGDKFAYTCAISEGQALTVEIAKETYQVLRWQVVTTADWESDDRIPVWTGS